MGSSYRSRLCCSGLLQGLAELGALRAMAACRRALIGLRHVHAYAAILRGPAAAVSRKLAVLDAQEDRWWTRGGDGWLLGGRAVWVHGTAWREDDDDGRGSASASAATKMELGGGGGGGGATFSKVGNDEARELVQQVHVASLKKRLREDERDCISYAELLKICQSEGMASTDEEAAQLVLVFNQAGVVLTFRDKVHLHPEKIAEVVANVLPLSLLGEDDQRRMELLALQKKKEEIDLKAHKQMRVVLWSGLVALTLQVLVFFRLTFWELSWDVMEPVAFFATAGGLICGYTYFLVTSRDPSYQDFMQRLYHSRQRKLFRKQNFDIKRFKELQMQCQSGWKTPSSTKKVLSDCD